MLQKAIIGDRDFAGHAANLFIDFVAIFIRLAIILAKISEKKFLVVIRHQKFLQKS